MAGVTLCLIGTAATSSRVGPPYPHAAETAMLSEEISEGPTSEAHETAVSTCDRRRRALTRAVVGRRSATWRWQDELEVPRTRSNFDTHHVRGCAYLRWLGRLWSQRADDAWRLYASLRDPKKAICFVFRSNCGEALAVSWCESHHTTTAANGQYLGLFQMGSGERARYGHGPTALEQARAAYRYFRASGRDWSPWQCQPGGGLQW